MYETTGTHSHPYDPTMYYQDLFKTALFAAIDWENTTNLDELYEEVKQKLGWGNAHKIVCDIVNGEQRT